MKPPSLLTLLTPAREADALVLGFVGAEAAKFTPATEDVARVCMATLMQSCGATKVVSGKCHLGGIDIWAIEEARRLGLDVEEFAPATREWKTGFMPRNIQIADASDRVYCLTVKTLPPGFKAGGWEFYCYHCQTSDHIKSGGCWTAKYAREKLGKPGEIIVIGG